MQRARIHILGASGAGTTTLGRALAQRLAAPHFDTDDFFWVPTDPPYRFKRPVHERLRLLQEMLGGRRDWVLSGSLDGWGDPLAPQFDLVVWLDTPTELRLARLRAREGARYGDAAIAAGGPMHAEHMDFLDWAAGYDTAARDGRNRQRHIAWLADLSCPALRLDGTEVIDDLAEAVIGRLAERPPAS
jgi:adenylate kinase family enzyme